MIAIIDYGVGNLFSLSSSFSYIGADVKITGDADEIRRADKLILPGVGAFEDAAKKLRDSGLASVICDEAKSGKSIMGICLGMQLLFEESLEYGRHKGLGLIPGTVEYMGDYIKSGLKIPHIGWNALDIKRQSGLLRYVKSGDFVYFVHSYFAKTDEKYISSTAEYGYPLTATVENGNVMGCQFHPEKSGAVGLNILKAFCEDQR